MKPIYQNFSRSALPKIFVDNFLKRYKRFLLKSLPYKKKIKLQKTPELIIVFTTDEKIHELNRRYRGRDYVTDILSFDSEDSSSLGELVMSPKKIRRQARQHKLTFREELAYLLIHGVLHLLGYEHEGSRKKASVMFKIQDEAFESLSRRSRRAKK
jgi:probable rRNA maturation factor